MRIDKYLWATRYYKTRSLAAQACKKGHVRVANQRVKASKDIFIGLKITLRKDQINYQLTVIGLPPNRVGAKLVDLYRRDETPKAAFEKVKSAKNHYREKGMGRPTKKDRRSLADFFDE